MVKIKWKSIGQRILEWLLSVWKGFVGGLNHLPYAFYIQVHPFDGFFRLKNEQSRRSIPCAVILYAMEYKNNRYAIVTNTKVYQYFSGNKMEYTAKVGRNRKKVILNFEAKDFSVNLDSTPVYVKKKEGADVIFPKEMMAFFPLNDKAYVVDALSEVYTNYDLNYLRIKRLDKSFDHMFLYDGKDLYFFLDEVTLIVGNKEITLSPMSYVSCSYLNMVEYYDYSNDKYVTIELGNENVYVKNDYMNIDVSLDKVIYKDSINLIGGKLSNYKKITDMEEK